MNKQPPMHSPYTPGPWEWQQHAPNTCSRYNFQGGRQVDRVYTGDIKSVGGRVEIHVVTEISQDEADANLRLIEHAPDMHALLYKLGDAIRGRGYRAVGELDELADGIDDLLGRIDVKD